MFFTSCGFTPAPEKALGKFLDHLGKGQFSQAESYVEESTIAISSLNRNAKKLYQTMFASISYTISYSTIVENLADVTVSITVADMESILSDASLTALENSFSGIWGDQKKMYSLVTEKINSPEVTYVSNAVAVRMRADENGKWKVVMGSSLDFADAITGGLGELIGY